MQHLEYDIYREVRGELYCCDRTNLLGKGYFTLILSMSFTPSIDFERSDVHLFWSTVSLLNIYTYDNCSIRRNSFAFLCHILISNHKIAHHRVSYYLPFASQFQWNNLDGSEVPPLVIRFFPINVTILQISSTYTFT